MNKNKILFPIKYNIIGLILLLLFIASCILKNISVDNRISQQVTNSWSDDGKGSSYVSLYISMGIKGDEFTFGALKNMISQNLQENLGQEQYVFDAGNPFAGPFTAAYSAKGIIRIVTPQDVVADDVNAYGVGGDFFIFHPVKLVAGRYFSDEDSMQDGIVIDTNTAYRLFGSSDCIDMSVKIGANIYKVVGVYEPEDSKYYKYADADAGFVFMPYEALTLDGMYYEPDCYEFLSIEPVEGFLYSLINDSDKNRFPRDSFETVQVSGRFDFIDLISNVLSKWGSRSMQTKPIVYPYWENVDRAYENFYAVFLLIQIVLAIYPSIIIFIYLYRLINNIPYLSEAAVKRIKPAIKESKKKKRKRALKNAKAIKILLLIIIGSFALNGCGKSDTDDALYKVNNIDVEGVSDLRDFQIIDLGDFNILYGADMNDMGQTSEHVIYYNNEAQVLRHIVILADDMSNQYVFDRDGNIYCLSLSPDDKSISASAYEKVEEKIDDITEADNRIETIDEAFNLDSPDSLDTLDEPDRRRGADDSANNDSEAIADESEELLHDSDAMLNPTSTKKRNISVDAIEQNDSKIKEKDMQNTAYLASNDDMVISDDFLKETDSESKHIEESHYYVTKINFKGELVKSFKLDDNEEIKNIINEGEDVYNSVSLVIDLDNVYIFINNNLVELDHNLEYSKMIPEKKLDPNLVNADFAYSKTGELYATYNNSNFNVVLAKARLNDGKTDGGYILPGESFYTRLYNGVDFDFSIYKNGNLYAFNYRDNNYKKIADFTSSNLPVDFVQSACGVDSNHFYSVYNSLDDGAYHFGYFEKTDASQIEQKITITVAMADSVQDIKKAAARFNKANSKYSVKVLDYYSMYSTGDYENDMLTVTEKLNTDIIAGNVPDVLIMNDNVSADKYINKGLFEDLKPYIDNDADFNLSDFNEHIFDVYSTGDKLYRIVPSYMLSTVCVKKRFVNERTSWDLDDVKLIMDKSNCDMFMPFAERTSIMEGSMKLANSQFINWKNGECSFDNADFKKLLEFVKSFPTQDDFMRNGMWDRLISKYNEMFRSDMVLCELQSISSYEWYQYAAKGDFGEEISLLGFPTADGKGNAINSVFSLAMYSKSKNKEGCWEFIRYFLSDEYQENLSDSFPIKNSALAKFQDRAKEEICYRWIMEDGTEQKSPMTYFLNGENIEIPPMTQEDIDKLSEIINNTYNTTEIDRKVLKIIAEESQEYFDDKATVDEVANRIQSRVQIYLYESQ